MPNVQYVEVTTSCPPCRVGIATKEALSPFKPVYMCDEHRQQYERWFGAADRRDRQVGWTEADVERKLKADARKPEAWGRARTVVPKQSRPRKRKFIIR